jgi:hypothetical protein
MLSLAPVCRAIPLLAVVLLAGCDAFSGLSRGPDPAVQRIPVAPRDLPQGSGYAGAGGITPSNYRPPLGGAVRDEAAVAEACRRDIDRVISTRDRGQLMREDEAGNRASGILTFTVTAPIGAAITLVDDRGVASRVLVLAGRDGGGLVVDRASA